jgi:DUF1365 family protein
VLVTATTPVGASTSGAAGAATAHAETGVSSALCSAVYTGELYHLRSRPKRNEFRYGIYFLYLDVDRLDDLDLSLTGFGHNEKALTSIWDVDHGPRDGSPLRPWIDEQLAVSGIELGDNGTVMLLAFPRVRGWKFYPASFWYCFGGDGTLRAVMAEVQNTYGEHHDYLVHCDGAPMAWSERPTRAKAMHVSPFIEMDARYTFSFDEPGESLGIRIRDDVEGEPLLFAKVSLERRPLDDETLRAVVADYGPMSLRAMRLIGWQALRLLGKGIRFLPKPAPPAQEVSR